MRDHRASRHLCGAILLVGVLAVPVVPAHAQVLAFGPVQTYQPSQPQKQVIRSMVREFVNRVFNGSAEPLLAHLVEDQHLTESDLNEIRRTIKAARKPK